MVRVKVGMRNYEALDKTTEVEVQLQVPQYRTDDFILPKIYVAYASIEYLEKNKGIVDFYIDPPTLIGDWTIFAEVDAENRIEEADENNNENSVEVTVKDTGELYVVYFPVERPDYGQVEIGEYIKTYVGSNDFILATYPISESEFIGDPRHEVVKGKASMPKGFGIWLDTLEIFTRAKLLGADVGIGIVPKGYFDYHGVSSFGMTFPGIKGAVVEEGTHATAAHEIGHMYGLEDEAPVEEVSGFWVARKQPVSPLALCFMTGAELYPWVCDECYTHLFKKFRVEKKDPEILVVVGIIYKNGTLELGKWYRVEEGKDDSGEIVPGDYTIELLDENANILQDISFSAEFKAFATPGRIVEIDFAPFALAIPYPNNASVARILYQNEIMTEVNLTTKLFNDAQDSLIQDYEILVETVERTDIHKEVKNGLLDKLTNATMKAEQGLAYINEGEYTLGENMLNSASSKIKAFLNEVNAQKGKKISEEEADGFTSWARKMILSLQNQITETLKTE